MRQMTHKTARSTARRGFTLLELLVAMTILTIIGTAIFTMFRQSTEMYSRTIAHTRQYVAAREALGLMTHEMRQARLVPVAEPTGSTAVGFLGLDEGNILAAPAGEPAVFFISPTGMRDTTDSKQDLCVIGYWLDGTEAPYSLMRYCLTDKDYADWQLMSEPSSGDLINKARNAQLGVLVRSLTFEYWGPGDTEWDPEDSDRLKWESWDKSAQDNTLPRAVRITLVVVDPSDSANTKRDRTFTTVVHLDNAL